MSIFKKIAQAAGNIGESILGGAVKTAGAIGSWDKELIRRTANITSGILTGNEDKITSNLKQWGSSAVRNTGAMLSGGLQFGTGGMIKSNAQNSSQYEKTKLGNEAKAEEQARNLEEQARPEKERQSLLNQQYQNTLLKSGGRGYNSLLGGGF